MADSGSKRFHDLPLPLRLHLAVTAVLALLVCTLLLPEVNWTPDQWILLICLLVLSAIFGLSKVRLTLDQQILNLGTVAVSLAQMTMGTRAAALCAGMIAIVSTYVRRGADDDTLGVQRVPLHRALFNLSACMVAAGVAGCVFEGVEAAVSGPALGNGQSLVPALAAWTGVYFLLNTLLVAFAIAFSKGERPFSLWRRHFLWLGPGFFASSSLGAGIYLLCLRYGLWAVLPVPVIYGIFEAYREHAARLQLQARHIQELHRLTESVVASLAVAVEAKDRYTREHIRRVQHYAVSLAEAAGVDEADREAVRYGALAHDIGKIAIPERILCKPGKLTPEEYRRMKTHVDIGAMILAPVRFPYPVVEAVRSHHERWDGLGYPDGLRGEQIPLGGRIIAIADIFDALTSDRPYRRAMAPEEALEVLRRGAGTQFDPRLVEIFIRIYPRVAQELEALRAADDQPIGEGPAGDSPASEGAPGSARFGWPDLSDLLRDPRTDDLFRVVLEHLPSVLPYVTAVIYEADAAGRELVATHVAGSYADALQGMTIRMGEGVAGRAAQDRCSFLNAAAVLDVGRVFDPTEHIELSAALCAPVVVGDEAVAVLALYHTSYDLYTEEHRIALTAIAGQVAAALAEQRRCAQERALLLSDPGTGLYNHRYLVPLLEQKLAVARRQERQVALVMLDLDGYRGLEERHGAAAVRDAAATLGQRLRECARGNDTVCRWADDQFIIVLDGAGQRDARRVAERVRRVVGEQKLGEALAACCSTGTAVFPNDGDSARALLAALEMRTLQDRLTRQILETPDPRPSGSPGGPKAR